MTDFPIKKKRFFKWLSAHKGRRLYNGPDVVYCCPLAQYAKDIGIAEKGERVSVGVARLSRTRHGRLVHVWKMPAWAEKFVDKVSAITSSFANSGDDLRIIRIGQVLPLLRKAGVRP